MPKIINRTFTTRTPPAKEEVRRGKKVTVFLKDIDIGNCYIPSSVKHVKSAGHKWITLENDLQFDRETGDLSPSYSIGYEGCFILPTMHGDETLAAAYNEGFKKFTRACDDVTTVIAQKLRDADLQDIDFGFILQALKQFQNTLEHRGIERYIKRSG